MTASDLFTEKYLRVPDGVFSAPGRVNLIGEHTDYTGGLVLPFGIDARATVAAGRIDEPVVRIASAQQPGAIIEAPFATLRPGSAGASGWPAYLFGTVWALGEAGLPIGGIELALDSSVPAGAGLSSSAAIECAVALAVSTLVGVRLTKADLARLAQRAENEFVGVPCGLMDQMASSACEVGNLLFFDTRSGATENIPFDPASSDLAVLVIDTRAHHSLADGEYAKRRASCEHAQQLLGLDLLREIDLITLPAALSRLEVSGGVDASMLVRRVRHVVTENARVEAVVERLRGVGTDWEAVGAELTASHDSLRDDFQVSSPELDTAVRAAIDAGALGARMTGGGFGGSAIALVPQESAAAVAEAVLAAFATADYRAPIISAVAPAAGARRED